MKKILVIDDAEFILESTSTLLKFEGYDVFTAADGMEGINIALQNKPDLILCDISMPNLDGYGVLERLRGEIETSTTPFIFLTAFTEKANMRLGMEKGADDFLVKPYTRDELIKAIDAQWTKHKNIEKQLQDKVQEVGRSVSYALPHEFRTVLNQVVGSAKYLFNHSEKVPAEEIRELSNDIINSSQRLIRITENFLIYIRIDSFIANPEKRRQLRNSKTDEPGAMIYDMAANFAQKQERLDDVEVNGIVEHLAVEISTESFYKIFDELLDNALKFSDKGTKINIDLSMEGDMFQIKIRDRGRGMSQEQIRNVGAYIQFERTIYEQQGVGLGLIIAKKLVEIHDGLFNIQSVEGEGTIITYQLHVDRGLLKNGL